MTKMTLKLEASYLKDIIKILSGVFILIICGIIFIAVQEISLKWIAVFVCAIINGWVLAKLISTIKEFREILKTINA